MKDSMKFWIGGLFLGFILGGQFAGPFEFFLGCKFATYHPIGYTNNPSKTSGRTGYYWFRPFSNKFPNWLDIGIPVGLSYDRPTAPAIDLPRPDDKFKT